MALFLVFYYFFYRACVFSTIIMMHSNSQWAAALGIEHKDCRVDAGRCPAAEYAV